MAAQFRITVRGVMSERFCQGFPGVRRELCGDHTVLGGDAGDGRPLVHVLAALANLGLDVVGVEAPRAASASEED